MFVLPLKKKRDDSVHLQFRNSSQSFMTYSHRNKTAEVTKRSKLSLKRAMLNTSEMRTRPNPLMPREKKNSDQITLEKLEQASSIDNDSIISHSKLSRYH